MEEKKKFDKQEYDTKYKKEHYSQFKVDLTKIEYQELCSLLEKKGIKKVDFVRKAFEELKKN